ncbi:MAG: hypothetical protein U1F43_09225 [Myxococcota bacterium]
MTLAAGGLGGALTANVTLGAPETGERVEVATASRPVAPAVVPEGDLSIEGDATAAGVTPLAPLDAYRGGVASWLASAPIALSLDGRQLALPDADSDSVVVLDADTLDQRAVIPVGRHPEHLLALPSGELAVACRGERAVQIIDLEKGQVTRTLATGAEPRGLAVTPDGSQLFVASFGSDEVRAYRTSDWAQEWVRQVDAMPVALAVDSTGRGLFVSHLQAASVSELDPRYGTLRGHHALPTDGDRSASMVSSLVPLADGRVAAPYVLARTTPADPVAASRSSSYGGGGDSFVSRQLVEGKVAVMASDTVPTAIGIAASGFSLGSRSSGAPPSMVAGARDPASGRLAMVDQIGSRVLIAEAGTLPTPETRIVADAGPTLRGELPVDTRFAGLGPGAATYSRDGKRLFIASWIDRSVTVLEKVEQEDGSSDVIQTHIGLFGQVPLDRQVARGRLLFNTGSDMISSLGVTCASCHPDGLQDGRTWMQSFGPRQTPQLAGRVSDTGPFNWLGSETSLGANLHRTIARLEGKGTSEDDTAALVAYMTRGLDVPDHERRGAPLTAIEARGQDVFNRVDVGCAGCHDPATAFTDGQTHDIGSTSAIERKLFKAQHRGRGVASPSFDKVSGMPMDFNDDNMMAPPAPPRPVELVPAKSIAFDTPSLIDVGRTAPYFHDGSAPTLRAVLTERNLHDRMGHTSQLSPADVDALVAYLERL